GVSEAELAPFYDAAWELCRRAVLRPGPAFPRGQHMGHTSGDGFSLTVFGRAWIQAYEQQGPVPADPGRFAAIIAPCGGRLGRGFVQRANEAAGCYRAMNYLACCAMVGAACESILLALATAKAGDEAGVLKRYRAGNGRKAMLDILTTGQSARVHG